MIIVIFLQFTLFLTSWIIVYSCTYILLLTRSEFQERSSGILTAVMYSSSLSVRVINNIRLFYKNDNNYLITISPYGFISIEILNFMSIDSKSLMSIFLTF